MKNQINAPDCINTGYFEKQSNYEKWLNNRYSNPGSFELAMFHAYTAASSDNRIKLMKAFPNFFKP